MLEKSRELLEKHGALSIPFLMRNLKCTQDRAIKLLNKLCPHEKMDHSLPLSEFIEKYRDRFAPLRKLAYKPRKEPKNE